MDDDIAELSNRPIHEPMGEKPLSHDVIDIEKIAEETPRLAPLFIKIDRYKEVLGNIQKLKLQLKNIQFLLTFKDQINKINAENDELLYKTVQNLNQAVNDFSSSFAVPRNTNFMPKPPLETRADESVSDLGEKISRLREELERIRV